MVKWIVAGVIATLLAFFHISYVEHVKNNINAEWMAKLNKAKEEARNVESKLIDDALDMEREKNAKISSLDKHVASLNYRLQQRPSRSSSVSEDTGAGEACTGAQLYREDGIFLAGEAARAERIRIERDYYYEQYENVRKKLDESNQP